MQQNPKKSNDYKEISNYQFDENLLIKMSWQE